METRTGRPRTAFSTALLLAVVGISFLTPNRAIAKDDDADPFPALPPGMTMTGVYVMGGTVAAASRTVGYIDAQINFPRRVLDHARYHVEIVRKGQASTEHCPGVRRAAAGYLCIYEIYKDERLSLGGVYNPIGTGGSIDRDGAALWGAVDSADSDDGDSPFSAGGWAITGRPRHD